jgi:serine protease Do
MNKFRPQMKSLTAAPKRSFRGALLATALGVSFIVPSFTSVASAESAVPVANLTQQAQQLSPGLPSLAPIVQKVMPAVVNISVTLKSDAGGDDQDDQNATPQRDDQDGAGGDAAPSFPASPFDQFLKRFYDQQPQGQGQNRPQIGKRIALGSGFIIDPQGYVVTNNHVVGEAETVTVLFQDGSKHPAKIVGRDEKTDLALLKIETDKPLPFVTWGDSDQAKVGDWIIAVGNPFGLGGTVTTGIVSARGRDIHAGPFDDFLQLDAAINRGNSGGPTFNQQGQVIGINTAIYSPNGGSVGIGFAIPSNLAKSVEQQLREHGKVDRGWLGVQIQQITPEIASSVGLKSDHGAIIADVTVNSPADKAGVKQGDIIVKYNGHDIDKLHDLPLLVAGTPINSKVDVTVWRNGKEETLQANVGQMPGDTQQVASNGQGNGTQANPEHASALGLQLGSLDQHSRQRLHLKAGVKGVVVTKVADDSPAGQLGIEPGDVIVAINQQPVATPADAAQMLKQAKQSGDKSLLLLMNRHGINQYVGLSVS